MGTGEVNREKWFREMKKLETEVEALKQEIKLLRESEEHFRSVTETATEAIITIDESCRVVSWNPAAEKMFGFSAGEIKGKTLDPIVPPGLRLKHQTAIKRALESGKLNLKGQPIELIGIRKDGSEFPLEISMTLWKTHEKTFKEKKNILVKVEDKGCGISPENLHHIVDPFFTTKRETGGTGLGLSVASTIVKEHGGSMNFKSTPGKGTIAIVMIPVIDG